MAKLGTIQHRMMWRLSQGSIDACKHSTCAFRDEGAPQQHCRCFQACHVQSTLTMRRRRSSHFCTLHGRPAPRPQASLPRLTAAKLHPTPTPTPNQAAPPRPPAATPAPPSAAASSAGQGAQKWRPCQGMPCSRPPPPPSACCPPQPGEGGGVGERLSSQLEKMRRDGSPARVSLFYAHHRPLSCCPHPPVVTSTAGCTCACACGLVKPRAAAPITSHLMKAKKQAPSANLARCKPGPPPAWAANVLLDKWASMATHQGPTHWHHEVLVCAGHKGIHAPCMWCVGVGVGVGVGVSVSVGMSVGVWVLVWVHPSQRVSRRSTWPHGHECGV